MFNNKPYKKINREERFFCSLFAHALLTSQYVRSRFAKMVCQLGVNLDPDKLEVYLEVAALRDYWNDLGDPHQYSSETHERRCEVVGAILRLGSIDSKIINSKPMFWTKGVGSKLCFPGRWNKKALEEKDFGVLKRVKWAFNAKPDMLLLSPTGALVLEAKVESSKGQNRADGYNQIKTQKFIVELWQRLIPSFSDVPIRLATLELGSQVEDGLAWNDVIMMINRSELDSFTKECIGELGRYQANGKMVTK